jgi:peroxin-13
MGSYGGYSRYGMGSSYGGYGGMGSYGSPYSRFGGGGMYGNGGMMGPGGPQDPSLMQRMEVGTRPAFEVIEQIVGAFGGFAQMLDSTFMATHSSFMAMVGMAEQLGYLKNYLGQVFSVFALYRMVKSLLYKVTGRVEPGKANELNLMEFQKFDSKPKISRKPILIFVFMVIGLPYLMHKLIQLITKQQEQQQQQQQQQMPGVDPALLQQGKIDPSKLEFARATYDFNGESQMELSLKKGDIVAILSKVDPATNQVSQWWRGRLRDGRMGMFPANYVEIVQKSGEQAAQAIGAAPSLPSSPASSSSSSVTPAIPSQSNATP